MLRLPACVAFAAQATKCAFSATRSCATATHAALGDTGHLAAKLESAAAGTFSNSVVMAALILANSLKPASSKYVV